MTHSEIPLNHLALNNRVAALQLPGLLAHWDELDEQKLQWIATMVGWEETERSRRGLERRLRNAHLGRFKSLTEFDWQWPEHCDQTAVADMMKLDFINEATNLLLVGNNGVGKSTIAQNIAHQAIVQGHSALFVNAAQMLGDLASRDSDAALNRRLKHYARPDILVIDEVGYLSYANRHADLLFEVVNRRYELKPIIVTTNKSFNDWGEVFPNAACVVSIVDRLLHHSQILMIEGESYRMHEAKQRAEKQKRTRSAKRKPKTAPKSDKPAGAQS